MITLFINEHVPHEFHSAHEMLDFFYEILGRWPDRQMRFDLFAGRTVSILSTHYRAIWDDAAVENHEMMAAA
jgi:hypothetical protein